MDRDAAVRYVEEISGRIAEGELRISAQRGLVAKLTEGGHDIRRAQSVAEELDRSQALLLGLRNQFLDEIARLPET